MVLDATNTSGRPASAAASVRRTVRFAFTASSPGQFVHRRDRPRTYDPLPLRPCIPEATLRHDQPARTRGLLELRVSIGGHAGWAQVFSVTPSPSACAPLDVPDVVSDVGRFALGSPSLLDVREVSVRFGGVVALDDLSFSVDENEICGLIGPNGAGKTTLFNVVSRIYEPNAGQVAVRRHRPAATSTLTRSPISVSPARSRTWRCSLASPCSRT